MNFIDTNVLVYAFDPRFPEKTRVAVPILSDALRNQNAWISPQVMLEFVAVAVRKTKQTPERIREFLDLLRKLPVANQTADRIVRAFEIHELCRISIWDALIVAAAEASGCDTILSEGLAAGETYCGVRVENPFR